MSQYRFDAKLWEWSGKGGWHFVTMPADLSGIVRMSVDRKAGFGSIRVSAEVCGHSWKTSLFPDARSGSYLLPVKADVRKKAKVLAGDAISVTLVVLD